jgi:parallel beta-helix repeat protein
VINVPNDYPTIQEAINVAQSGDTVLVAAGTYNGPIILPANCSGVVLQGAGDDVTIISGMIEALQLDSNITIDGFTFTNASKGIYFASSSGSSPTITNCTFADSIGYAGIELWGQSSSINPTITGCKFYNNGRGIYMQHVSPSISNCMFINTPSSRSGIQISGNSSPNIINCLFSGSSYYGIEIYGWGSPTIVNCTITNQRTGIYSIYTAGTSIKNSIIWNNSYSTSGSISSVTYSNVQTSTTPYPGTGNINEDPLFRDPLNGDFRLLTGSPCIDTGTASGAPVEDIEGTIRPQGSGYDMGAYEYTLVPSLDCPDGFMPPVQDGTIKVKKNRCIPFKAALQDEGGNPVTYLESPPIIQIVCEPAVGGDAYSVDGLPSGEATIGNQFQFIDGLWHFNLKVKNCCTAQGLYTVTMESGDPSEYEINPPPTATFLVD